MCLNRFGNHWFGFFVLSPSALRAINNRKRSQENVRTFKAILVAIYKRVIICLWTLHICSSFGFLCSGESQQCWGDRLTRFYVDLVLCWLLYQVFFLPCLSVIVRVARRQTDSFKILSSFPICQPAIQWHWCVQVARISWQQLTKDGAVHWSWVLLARAAYPLPSCQGLWANCNSQKFLLIDKILRRYTFQKLQPNKWSHKCLDCFQSRRDAPHVSERTETRTQLDFLLQCIAMHNAQYTS